MGCERERVESWVSTSSLSLLSPLPPPLRKEKGWLRVRWVAVCVVFCFGLQNEREGVFFLVYTKGVH